VFFPHVPVARRAAPAGATVLGVAHIEKRGLWTTALTVMGPEAQGTGMARWLRELPADAVALPLGTPLFDAVGRVVALIANPSGAGPRAVEADGLLRFLLEANAPALRFAGVPPFRRPAPGETRGPVAHVATKDAAKAKDAAKGTPKDARRHDDEPSLEGLARVHRRGLSAPGVPMESSPPVASASPAKTVSAPPGPGGASFPGVGNALIIAAAELDKRSVPATVTIEVRDVPERGPRGAAVTIVELGDYHAPETREAEAALRALVEGPAAQARWLWKDTDRGEGEDYHLPARAAHAAREQDEFWPMHDILMKAPMPISMKDIRRIARAFDLEMPAFEAAYASEGLVGALETESEQAARLPALATPAFIVNGHLIDGGSVAGPALRAAVEQELVISEAKLASQPAAAIEALLAARVRGIAAGKPVAGTAFDATKMARTVTAALAKQSGKKH
jgi:protein-disulfide isomerase